ncbi:MAG: hypothetical protein PHC41_10585 [Lachnospiraceae bacterium]|nr:hypothetical protein [Lachnospiraceae bacterium]MDD3616654.1 hypothetical protein [Lachnospiraceae bacterium]
MIYSGHKKDVTQEQKVQILNSIRDLVTNGDLMLNSQIDEEKLKKIDNEELRIEIEDEKGMTLTDSKGLNSIVTNKILIIKSPDMQYIIIDANGMQQVFDLEDSIYQELVKM